MQSPAQVQAAAPVVTTTVNGVTIVSPGTATPTAIYRALRDSRDILENQRSDLESTQRELSQKLSSGEIKNPIDQKGIEQRLTDVNTRISDMDKAIADANAQVARAAAIPGATARPPEPPRNGPPEEFYALSALFMCVVLLPITIAYSRRIWRRAANKVPNLPKELDDRLSRLDQAMESIAVEVERVGEAQRFMTNVMTESNGARALGAGPAERIEVREREKVGARKAEY